MNLTVKEFEYYSDITRKLFNYMNGRVNRILCTLEIRYLDTINHAMGNIVFPNFVTVYLGTISENYTPNIAAVMTKENFMITSIAWSICHELFHSDQLISMVQYGSNQEYKEKVEMAVELKSHNWICDHIDELSSICNFRFGIEDITTNDLEEAIRTSTKYKSAGVKEYYIQTIFNIILKNLDMLYDPVLDIFVKDDKAANIFITFEENKDTLVQIKKDGKYLSESMNKFAELVYLYSGRFHRYEVTATVDYYEDGKTVLVDFGIENAIIKPIMFKED